MVNMIFYFLLTENIIELDESLIALNNAYPFLNNSHSLKYFLLAFYYNEDFIYALF